MKKEDLPKFIKKNHSLNRGFSSVSLLHVGYPKNTTTIVKNWQSNSKFQVIIWTAQSSDINLVENL